MRPHDLLTAAADLANAGKGKPKQAHLRRAVSTAYYALFHALARNCADHLIGASRASRSNPAWNQVYRALRHGSVKDACRQTTILARFPRSIQEFADVFVQAQTKRERAAYDPDERVFKSSVLADIATAADAVRKLEDAAAKDRRAFAAFVLFKRPRA